MSKYSTHQNGQQREQPHEQPSGQQSEEPGHETLLREKLGLGQWFHYEAYDDVLAAMEVVQDLGIKHFRTNISWADFVRPGGRAWYDWQMNTVAQAGVETLVSVWHVPPSYSEGNACNAPPRRLLDYADFIDQVITLYGDKFDTLAFWNEPNSRYEWNFKEYDPKWAKFGEMVLNAAHWAKQRGQTTVLGGMMPVDHTWLELMRGYGVLEHIDIIAIHAFPEMWWQDFPNWEWYDRWRGWADRIAYVTEHAGGRPIWVAETGLATWDPVHEQLDRFDLQVLMLERAAAAPADRIYWYSAIDLDPRRSAVEGFHVDENEYHLGLMDYDGEKKPAYYRFKELLGSPVETQPQTYTSDSRRR